MEETTPSAGMVRPLGFGELFDRAVTLYVRNFVPFSLIVLIVMIPNAIAQYSMQAQSLAQISTLLKGGVGASTSTDPLAVYSSGSFGFAMLMLLIFFLCLPFMFNAVALGVARLYSGQPVDLRACYGRALRRFWPTVGLVVMAVLIFFGAIMGMGLMVGLVAAVGIGIGMLGKVFAVLGVVIVVVLYLALIGMAILISIALGFAMLAVVIEEKSVFDSIGAGFSRVFTRGEIGRAMFYALASLAISIANLLIVYAVMGLAIFLHQPWLVTLENVVVTTAIYTYSTILFAVYYYDVRIRREGLDLASALESLVPTVPA